MIAVKRDRVIGRRFRLKKAAGTPVAKGRLPNIYEKPLTKKTNCLNFAIKTSCLKANDFRQCGSTLWSFAMYAIRESLRTLLMLLAVGLGIWWLSTQGETLRSLVSASSAGTVSRAGDVCVMEVDWDAADSDRLVTRSRGDLPGGVPMWEHSTTDGSSQPLPVCGPVRESCHGKDGKWLIVSDDSEAIRVDCATGETVVLLEIPRQQLVTGLAISGDGARVAVTIGTKLIVCDTQTAQVLSQWPDLESLIGEVSFSGDGEQIALATNNGAILVGPWRDSAPACIMRGHAGPATRVRFLPDGRLLSAGLDDTLRLWNVEKQREEWNVHAQQMGLLAMAVSADGKTAATGGFRREVLVWDLERRSITQTVRGAAGAIRDLEFSPDGNQLAIAANDPLVHVWNLNAQASAHAFDLRAFPSTR